MTLLPAAFVLLAAPLASAGEEASIVYRPPADASVPVRVVDPDRAGERPLPSVAVLAPDHAGWTATDQPTLAFYQGSEGDAERIEVAVTPSDGFEPIFETALDAAPGEGVRQLSLADHDVRLDPSREYEVTVSAVGTTDDGGRAERTARAGIRYMPPRTAFAGATSGAGAGADESDLQRAIRLAGGGVWYDAIAALTRVIHAGGEDAVTAHRLRSQLLRQVDLALAADFDDRLASRLKPGDPAPQP